MSGLPPTIPQANDDLTALLATLGVRSGNEGSWATGGSVDQRSADALVPAVYEELRAIAQSLLHSEHPDHTLQATALVHEAYLKLAGQDDACWHNRGHFFAIAGQAMRRILVDHARGRRRLKRGGGERPLLLSDVCAITPQSDIDILALDEAMQQLAEDDPMDARIVEMRFFAGLEVREIAEILGVSCKTVQRHWNYSRAWLYRALSGGAELEEQSERP